MRFHQRVGRRRRQSLRSVVCTTLIFYMHSRRIRQQYELHTVSRQMDRTTRRKLHSSILRITRPIGLEAYHSRCTRRVTTRRLPPPDTPMRLSQRLEPPCPKPQRATLPAVILPQVHSKQTI